MGALCACAPNAEAPPAEPPPDVANGEARICPADGYLNCMPIVPAERRSYCSAEYRAWITNNYPHVEIVY